MRLQNSFWMDKIIELHGHCPIWTTVEFVGGNYLFKQIK